MGWSQSNHPSIYTSDTYERVKAKLREHRGRDGEGVSLSIWAMVFSV